MLTIVANERGAQSACAHAAVDYLGFPFSLSENFQMRNTRKTIAESTVVLERVLELCEKNDKQLVVYLSMGFGNPYGDPWSVEIVAKWVEQLAQLSVRTFSLSDTVGAASTSTVNKVFSQLIPAYSKLHFGAHLHCKQEEAVTKLEKQPFVVAVDGLMGLFAALAAVLWLRRTRWKLTHRKNLKFLYSKAN